MCQILEMEEKTRRGPAEEGRRRRSNRHDGADATDRLIHARVGQMPDHEKDWQRTKNTGRGLRAAFASFSSPWGLWSGL